MDIQKDTSNKSSSLSQKDQSQSSSSQETKPATNQVDHGNPKKKKQMRMERRNAKLLAKGLPIDHPLAKPNADTSRKTLTEFLNEEPKDGKHKLKVKQTTFVSRLLRLKQLFSSFFYSGNSCALQLHPSQSLLRSLQTLSNGSAPRSTVQIKTRELPTLPLHVPFTGNYQPLKPTHHPITSRSKPSSPRQRSLRANTVPWSLNCTRSTNCTCTTTKWAASMSFITFSSTHR